MSKIFYWVINTKSQCNPVTGIILPYIKSKWEADLPQKYGQLLVKILLTSNCMDCFELVESQTQQPLLHTEQDTVCGEKTFYKNNDSQGSQEYGWRWELYNCMQAVKLFLHI